ncbi:SRPBCC domain-containing protein [Kordiimonas sp.]|uniref:SRPBCC domain-containing protein n=1 Tax=Kordiimonas sp. TaxID=1970157 RepID=UPI003A91350A
MTHFPRTVAYTVERFFSAPRPLVFGAWADPVARSLWFGAVSGTCATVKGDDFRIGGQEQIVCEHDTGPVTYDILYRAIVPNQSIVYECRSLAPESRVASSVVTVEFRREGEGTRLVLREKLNHVTPHALSVLPNEPLKAAAGFC